MNADPLIRDQRGVTLIGWAAWPDHAWLARYREQHPARLLVYGEIDDGWFDELTMLSIARQAIESTRHEPVLLVIPDTRHLPPASLGILRMLMQLRKAVDEQGRWITSGPHPLTVSLGFGLDYLNHHRQ